MATAFATAIATDELSSVHIYGWNGIEVCLHTDGGNVNVNRLLAIIIEDLIIIIGLIIFRGHLDEVVVDWPCNDRDICA